MKVKVWHNTQPFTGAVRLKDLAGIIQRVGQLIESQWVPGQDVGVAGSYFLLGGRDSIDHALQTGSASFINASGGDLLAMYNRVDPGFGKKMVTIVAVLDVTFYINMIVRSGLVWNRLPVGGTNVNAIGFLDLAKALRNTEAQLVKGITKLTGVS